MASRLNPYLRFDGTARQAMEFYKDVFGGTLTVNTFGEYGAPDPGSADKIMHALLETPSGFTLMAADTPPGHTQKSRTASPTPRILVMAIRGCGH